jgi:hypothetical protein
VKEVLSAADSAYPALITVKYLFLQEFIVKELAHITVVPSKLDPALLTLRFNL